MFMTGQWLLLGGNREIVGSIPGVGLFSPSILSNVSLNKSLEEVQYYCFSYLKK